MSLFDIKVKDIEGKETSLKEYEGKVLLIVNTATECGFTPQYEDLQNLYEKYGKDGLIVLDFPCNQFGHQAPGSDDEIRSFCSSRFGVTFPQYSKIDVNGANESELFKYLKSVKGFEGFDKNEARAEFLHQHLLNIDKDYAANDDIKWNFTKFLVDRAGNIVERFEPIDNNEKIESKIKELL